MSSAFMPTAAYFSNRSLSADASAGRPIVSTKCSLSVSRDNQKLIEKVREKIKNGKAEVSPSAYDTAWVAMVPSRDCSGGKQPCFPQCLDWIMGNQNPDGSWHSGSGSGPGHPFLVKDSLACTLACVIALTKWNVGQKLVQKGLEFVRSNAWAVKDKDQIASVAFDIIFLRMINYANQLDLTLPVCQDLLESMLRNRESQTMRNRNTEYVAEMLGESINWNKLLMQQCSNGSLFNSPAATAAALVHYQHNTNSYEYLDTVLRVFEKWAPNIYPVDICNGLCMVDTLKRLGVDRYFQSEINSILEETYRLWKQKEGENFGDITSCAMAFRLLRMEGYDISSDGLAPYADEEYFFDMASLQMSGLITVLELYRASHVRIHEDESTLEKLHDWTSTFLKQQLLDKAIVDKNLEKQVECELNNFHGILDRVQHRRTLDLYDIGHYQIPKSAYRFTTVNIEDLVLFAKQDFNICQSQNRKELEELERWYADCRLDSLKFGRNAMHVSHFLNSATMSDPQLSEARVAFAKTAIMVTPFDDFFDHHGSREEVLKIIELIKEWNDPSAISYDSKEVEILYTGLHKTLTDLAAKAYIQQGHCIKNLLVNLWVELLTNFMSEMDSATDEIPPSMEEYLSFAWVTIACRICILTAIHFMGIKLSEEVVLSPECTSLCMHVSKVTRLLNDIQTYKKEQKERKLNSVVVEKLAHKGAISEEECVRNIQKMVEFNRRKLLQLVLQTKGSLVPRDCKKVFWMVSNISYYLYSHTDEFTNPQQMMEDMKILVLEPLTLPPQTSS